MLSKDGTGHQTTGFGWFEVVSACLSLFEPVLADGRYLAMISFCKNEISLTGKLSGQLMHFNR